MARLVPQDVLQRLFNGAGYAELVKTRRLRLQVDSSHDPQPGVNEPPGTRSQLVSLWTSDGVKVATCHRYLRPDGTIGASGKLDPKMVLVKDEWYYTV